MGDDPASTWYGRQLARTFVAHGLATSAALLPPSATQAEAASRLAELARDDGVHGILLQLPLPPGLVADRLVEALPLHKDVEGLHPYHAGRLALGRPSFVPSTPAAGLEVLRRAAIELRGRLAVIVGRSPVVGRPLASLLLQADCTVVICHTGTRELAALTGRADVLLVAAGRPRLIDGSMIRAGATVLDFGTSEVEGRLVGDVDFDSAAAVAGAITPVPGGIGPVTVAMLGRAVLHAAGR